MKYVISTCLSALFISPLFNAQECLWQREPIDGLEYSYNAADFGLRGDVKSCTKTHETRSEKGEYEIIHGVWGDHYFVEHLNFNERGQLISRYEKTNEGDTMVIVLIDYDSKHRILKVQEHVANIWREHQPYPSKNWESVYLNYIYEKGILSAIVSNGQKGDPFNGDDDHKLIFEYKKGRLVKKTIQIGVPARDTLNVREYKYFKKSGVLDELNTTREGYTTIKGSMKYHYAEDKERLISKSFTPDFSDEMYQKSYWKFDAHKNIISYISGDTLQGMWYCHKKYEYNTHNDIISDYTNMEMDGRARLISEYAYEYDERNNWTQRFMKLHHYISYGGGTEPDQFFRERQEIEYY